VWCCQRLCNAFVTSWWWLHVFEKRRGKKEAFCKTKILYIRLFNYWDKIKFLLTVNKYFPTVNKYCCLSTCSVWLSAVSHNLLLLTAEEHPRLLARRAVAGLPAGSTFDRTGRITPKRDCCRHVSNSCHCNNGYHETSIFSAKKLLFHFWLVKHALYYKWAINRTFRGYLDGTYVIGIVRL